MNERMKEFSCHLVAIIIFGIVYLEIKTNYLECLPKDGTETRRESHCVRSVLTEKHKMML